MCHLATRFVSVPRSLQAGVAVSISVYSMAEIGSDGEMARECVNYQS